jgi:hypothetical protein
MHGHVSLFLKCETRIASARLPSTYARTVYKFSLTSPTRTQAHQFLNPRQSGGFEDL